MTYRVSLSPAEISERLMRIEALKKSFDALNWHVVITDDNANILYANKAAERNTGFSLKEMIGKNPGDLWGGRMPDEFYEGMWRTIKKEKRPFVAEVENTRKDGTRYWQELHISPVLDEDGEARFFIALEPDITERKQRDKFREEFIAATAHQLRNPLTAIRWVLEELLSGSALGDQERKSLEIVYSKDRHLSDLVRDLLVLTRMEGGSLKPETIYLDELVKEAIEAAKQKQPTVSFVFHNEEGPMPLETIPSLALEVFLNIIHNASEHADEKNGVVTVELARTPEGIRISSRNNGPPIPEELKPRIFSKIPSVKGAGLGLFIVKMISDHLGWEVSFETNETSTTFYVVIPENKHG
jgi:PAS domain S-box-containing protein